MSSKELICASCVQPITDKKILIRCCDSKCKKPYHTTCVNFKQTNPDTSKSWLCPACRCAMKKGGDNSSTPVCAPQNVTTRKPRPQPTVVSSPPPSPSSSDVSSALADLTEEIKFLREEIVTMKAGFDVTTAAVSRCESRMDDILATLSTFEARLSVAEGRVELLSELKRSNDALQIQITSQSSLISTYEARIKSLEDSNTACVHPIGADEALEERLSLHSQALLRNDVEITGVSEKPGENPHHLFLTLAAKAGLRVSDSDVDFVTRAGPSRVYPNDPPRPLVARFCRRHTRDQFYSTARSRRLTTADLEIDGPTQKIYINERLTRENRYLFRQCRSQFKAAGYKYCWTKWGRIYVKKQEGNGAGSKAIIVRSLGHIANILGENIAAPVV